MNVEVNQQQTRTNWQGEKVVSKMEVSASYSLNTSQVEDGIQVNFHNNSFEINNEPPMKEDWIKNMVQRLATLFPAYIVSNDGALLRVSELKAYQSAFQEEIDTLISEIKSDSEYADDPQRNSMFGVMKAMFDGMLTEDTLYAGIHSSWKKEVGHWIGFELQAGTTYETTFVTPVPMLNNAEIPSKAVYELLGSVECEADAGTGVAKLNSAELDHTLACVELKYTAILDSEAAKSSITKLFNEMEIDIPEDLTMTLDNEYYLITEKNSLLPHASLETTTVVASTPEAYGTVTQTHKTQNKYTYKGR